MLSRQGSVGASQGGACQHSTLVIHLATNDAAKESAWALAEPVEPAALPALSVAGQAERSRRQGGASSCDVARPAGIRFRCGAGVACGLGSAWGASVACGAAGKGVACLAGICFHCGAGSACGAGVAGGACSAGGEGVARLAGISFGISFGSGACAAGKSVAWSAAVDGQPLGMAPSNTNCALCHPTSGVCCVQSYHAHLCFPSLRVLTYVIRARLRLLWHSC